MTKPIKILYVDCAPLYGPVVHAHELIQKAHEELCNDLQVHHYKLVDFGKGPGMLAHELKNQLSSLTLDSVVLQSRYAEGRDCLQVLMELSEQVIT